jgi:hypothetical protein
MLLSVLLRLRFDCGEHLVKKSVHAKSSVFLDCPIVSMCYHLSVVLKWCYQWLSRIPARGLLSEAVMSRKRWCQSRIIISHLCKKWVMHCFTCTGYSIFSEMWKSARRKFYSVSLLGQHHISSNTSLSFLSHSWCRLVLLKNPVMENTCWLSDPVHFFSKKKCSLNCYFQSTLKSKCVHFHIKQRNMPFLLKTKC